MGETGQKQCGRFADRAKSGWSVEDWINQAGHDWFGYSVPWAKDGSAQAYNNRRAHEETDRAKKLQDAADMAQAELLHKFLDQNGGRLSQRARTKEFAALNDTEVEQIEALYAGTFDQPAQ
ncbi:hypothetical protein [Rhizobium sp. B21/90]|uniref:hypothetical protein n=1 Tax=Rhizobium sp. B21/90 TaxID=2819993 RepID=UPI00214B50E6|nr:hypothetical protein [Rhizobium sp. B21/90]